MKTVLSTPFVFIYALKPPVARLGIGRLNKRETRQDADNDAVVVTGGVGFVGSHLVDALVAQGYRVHVIDSAKTGAGGYLNAESTLHEADVRDPALLDIVQSIAPSTIFHLAAQVSVSVSAKDPALDADVNIMGSLNVFNAALRCEPMPKIVFASTGGAIYGELDESQMPVSESVAAQPVSPYGASKLTAERYLGVYSHLHGLRYTILRPANIYGPRQNPHGEAGVVAIFTQAMLDDRNVTIFGDGTFEKDYIFVSDLVEAIVAAAKSDGNGPYNISSGGSVSVNEIFRRLSGLTGYMREPVHAPDRAGDVRMISLDATRAAQELGWRQSTSFEDGLELTVDWFREERN